MTKTTIGWLTLYFGGISASFWKGPIIALLTYFFTFYTQYSWAKPYTHERWSLYASIALLLAYIVKKNSQRQLTVFKMPQLKWLLLFAANALFVSVFAVDSEFHKKEVVEVIKLIALYYLIICVVRTKLHYKLVIWIQVWGCYLFGWQSYGKRLYQGRLEGVGGPATSTSNGLASHVIMVLPFLNNMFFFGKKWERIAAIYAAPWILNVIVLCNSRGSFLGMLVMLIMIYIRADKKMRKTVIIGTVLGGILFIYLSDARFWNRMDKIYNGNHEESERIVTWLGALDMISENPLGAGGGGFVYLSPIYIPDIVAAHGGQKRSVHNSYLDVATSYGVQGLILYGLFVFSTLSELRRIRKRTGAENDMFYHSESIAIEIALWGFLVAAAFGSRAYFEAFFWFTALAVALSNMQQSEIIDRRKAESAETEEVRAAKVAYAQHQDNAPHP